MPGLAGGTGGFHIMNSPPLIRLSPEQQAVVDYPLRPLRVSAGAGTGKTTTVSYRMARLVREEGIPPEQLLGLTFTNKAAEELSLRIHQALLYRADPLREVEVNTYHGFCSGIVTEFGALLGLERNLFIIAPAQTRQLVKQVIRETSLPGLDNTDLFYLPGAIIRFSSSLADHLLEPDQINDEMLRSELPQLANIDFSRKSDFEDYERLASTFPKRRGMVEAAHQYQTHKRRLGVVDYGDLILQAHRIISTEPQIARRIRNRYRAVVADEYQDTNTAQRVILQILFGAGFPLTVVGDSDQTLYEWRGASLDNFRSFPSHFPSSAGTPAHTLPLTLNRRSGRRAIEFANRVRQEIGAGTSPLIPLPDAPPSQVFAEWHPTFIDEATWIAEQLIERNGQGRSWRDMAVLFRKTKDILGVYRQLTTHDIPVEVANLGGLLAAPEVVEIHSWLKVIGRFDDRTAATRLLGGSRFRLGLGEIRHLSRFARRDPNRPPQALLDGLDYPMFWDELPDSLAEPFHRFHDEYRELLRDCQGRPAGDACRKIVEKTRAWADVESMSDNARLSARLNLYRFLDLAESWSPLEGPSTIEAFLEYLDALLEEPSEELDAARLSDEDAVALLTVHKAKGLEWPVVFVPAIYQQNFPSQVVGGYDNPYRKAETLPWGWRIDPPRHDPITATMDAETLIDLLKRTKDEVIDAHRSQEWRIAYVASTRAKEELVLSGAHWYGYPEPSVKPKLPHTSDFFKTAWQATRETPVDNAGQTLEQTYLAPPRPESFATPTQAVSAPDPVFGEKGWPEGIRRAREEPDSIAEFASSQGVEEEYLSALEEFEGLLFRLPDPAPETVNEVLSTSATGLVSYAQCPKKYFWMAVDPLPRRYSYLTRRGTQIHRQIELHHQGKVPLLEPDSEIIELVGDDRPVDSPTGADPFQVFLDSRFSGMKTQWLEKAFTLRIGEDAMVRGRIDAVYQKEADTWEIVDFKSGRPPPDDPHGARLAQMQVYALAIGEIPELGPAPANLSVTIAYLGGGRLVENPSAEPVDETWLAAARQRLEGMARSIAEQKWDPTPSAECRKCDFFHVCPEGKTFIASIERKS